MKRVDPRARALTAAGYLVGLLCVIPVSWLMLGHETAAGTDCGTFLAPELSEARLADAEASLRERGGTATDAARLRHVAKQCNDALHERRMWTLAAVGMGFAAAVAVPAAGRARLRATEPWPPPSSAS